MLTSIDFFSFVKKNYHILFYAFEKMKISLKTTGKLCRNVTSRKTSLIRLVVLNGPF